MQWWIIQPQTLNLSTPEGFDAFVQKIEGMARHNPAYYRRRLKLLAYLGYAYILFIPILLLIVLFAIQQILLYVLSDAIIAEPSVGPNFFIFFIFIFWIPQFFVRFRRPTGIVLQRKQVPQLFAILDQLSSVLKAPKLNTVILNDELNAAIMQRPRFGFIGWQTNYLIIGLPLMQVLSPQQCQAVLAHEFAHLCGDDGRTAAWIYRIRRVWYELAEGFEGSAQGNVLFKRFFRWYGPFFKAYSFVHARAQEYEADRRAAEIVGAHHKAEALIGLNVNSVRLVKQFYPDFERRARDLKEPPDNFISQLLATLQSDMKSEQCRKWLMLQLTYQTDNSATHPCLADRLNALEYSIPAVLKQPQERAIELLDDQLDTLIEQLNQLWKKENGDAWQDNYELNQNQLDRLNNLNAKAKHLLTIEERLKQASMTWALQNKQAAIPIFESIVADVPENTIARYWLGSLLINQRNEEVGIDHLKFVLEHDPSLLISACRQLYSFYIEQDKLTLAESYKQRWQQHKKNWSIAQEERTKFDNTTQFRPHDLSVLETEQLVAYFSHHSEIKAAYLARRVVERFPEHPYYVLLVVRHYIPGMGADYKSDRKLKQLLKSEIAFSKDYTLCFITDSAYWQRLKQLKGTMLYCA